MISELKKSALVVMSEIKMYENTLPSVKFQDTKNEIIGYVNEKKEELNRIIDCICDLCCKHHDGENYSCIGNCYIENFKNNEPVNRNSFFVLLDENFGLSTEDVISVSYTDSSASIVIRDNINSPIVGISKLKNDVVKTNIVVCIVDKSLICRYNIILEDCLLCGIVDNGFDYNTDDFHTFKLEFKVGRIKYEPADKERD